MPFPAPTHAPTEKTLIVETAAPTALCLDDPTWHKKNKPNQDCSWVGKKPEKRCNKKNDDKVKADDGCPLACLNCPGPCEDAASWHKKNKPNQDCSWVAKNDKKRCNKKGQDKTRAYESCLLACDMCEFGSSAPLPW